MILGFKKEFEYPIVVGSKIHTIREDSKDRWDEGKKIHFVVGNRTKNYKQIKLGECIRIQYVFMTFYRGLLEVSVGDDHYCDKYLTQLEILQLAKNDGFIGVGDFMEWFVPLIKASEKGCFSGKIIHWTDFKY
ncbi:hypothetical protein [Sphingobacterium luzhongxinii]|uniref:hypothetical protein n=1 Tax=Sphingobacterium luzhongxinii TaxID=2654181 RepID=UPI0013DCF9AC|nr:hypothetical protein [Sphingobacterium sp. xlx-73]